MVVTFPNKKFGCISTGIMMAKLIMLSAMLRLIPGKMNLIKERLTFRCSDMYKALICGQQKVKQ